MEIASVVDHCYEHFYIGMIYHTARVAGLSDRIDDDTERARGAIGTKTIYDVGSTIDRSRKLFIFFSTFPYSGHRRRGTINEWIRSCLEKSASAVLSYTTVSA